MRILVMAPWGNSSLWDLTIYNVNDVRDVQSRTSLEAIIRKYGDNVVGVIGS